MAAATTNLGIVATISTTASQPYLTARRLASMDHMSRGRIGWNIVTSSHKGGVQSFGIDALPPHDERYERAEEYVALCKILWGGWSEDAVVADRERGMFIDPARVADVRFDGRWFKCHGPLNVHRSPQGGPLLAQAGASPVGIAFAARHAELVFAIQPYREGMRGYYRAVKDAVANAGREPAKCKVMFAMYAFIGDTESEALEKQARHIALITPERGMTAMSGLLGYDLSTVDPHTSLADLKVPGTQGHIKAWTEHGANTVFDASVGHAAGAGPAVVGTPMQVADWMCETMEFVGGDGFVFEPLYLPHDLHDFTQKVVPILQKRGLTRTTYSGKTLRDNVTAF
jgi:FMN-dependent oxidoreductase (nitrilotriacetate monooxygenase family)